MGLERSSIFVLFHSKVYYPSIVIVPKLRHKLKGMYTWILYFIYFILIIRIENSIIFYGLQFMCVFFQNIHFYPDDIVFIVSEGKMPWQWISLHTNPITWTLLIDTYIDENYCSMGEIVVFRTYSPILFQWKVSFPPFILIVQGIHVLSTWLSMYEVHGFLCLIVGL